MRLSVQDANMIADGLAQRATDRIEEVALAGRAHFDEEQWTRIYEELANDFAHSVGLVEITTCQGLVRP